MTSCNFRHIASRVNGQTLLHHVPANGDLIRPGEMGPLLRLRVLDHARTDERRTRYKTMRELIDDCVDCARAEDGFPVHSLETLLKDLATLSKLRMRFGQSTFDQVTASTALQSRTFELLQVSWQI